jgi:hypothetical protein
MRLGPMKRYDAAICDDANAPSICPPLIMSLSVPLLPRFSPVNLFKRTVTACVVHVFDDIIETSYLQLLQLMGKIAIVVIVVIVALGSQSLTSLRACDETHIYGSLVFGVE